MAFWSEPDINRLRKNPQMVRDLAARVLRRLTEPHALTEWEGYDFLPSIISKTWIDEFTDPQIEKVLEIEFLSRPFDLWDGVNTHSALSLCHRAIVDMDEDDEVWILERHERIPQVIYGRDVRRLIRLTRQFVYAEAA